MDVRQRGVKVAVQMYSRYTGTGGIMDLLIEYILLPNSASVVMSHHQCERCQSGSTTEEFSYVQRHKWLELYWPVSEP